MFAPIYLDHNATTPVHPMVLDAMLPWFSERPGNASSRHEYGRAARKALDEARQRVAEAVGAHPTEVVFTGSGSEANNLFIKGAAACFKPGLIAVSSVEHPSVREPALWLGRQGWKVHQIAVGPEGRINSGDYAQVLQNHPLLISVMLANNETGVMQDVADHAAQATMTHAWFHSDAVQAFGKVPVSFRDLNANGVHALTISSHKIGGPKGAASLILDKRVELRPLISGGGHERGLRSGTENVPAIVGFGMACEIAVRDIELKAVHLCALRDELEAGLFAQGATIFSQAAERLPNTTYFAFSDIDGDTLVGKLDRAGFAVASGAACSSANPEPSHVLLAMKVAPEIARGAVRVSLGVDTTAEQVHDFLVALQQTLFQLKRMTAVAV
ncbi:MAG: cysteine desulfurase family protein [Georgfuchsia sp.]